MATFKGIEIKSAKPATGDVTAPVHKLSLDVDSDGTLAVTGSITDAALVRPSESGKTLTLATGFGRYTLKDAPRVTVVDDDGNTVLIAVTSFSCTVNGQPVEA